MGNKYFQYAATVTLNHGKIESHLEGVSSINSFLDKFNWEGINYPSKIYDLETFEKNNPIIALNILYTKEKELCPVYISNINCEKQIILLIIPNNEKGDCILAVKRLSTLLRGITSKHHGDFYCLNCPHSFRTENKLKSHERICKNKGFCGIVMSTKKDNILEFNQYMKSNKMPYIINVDTESLIKNIDGCGNKPENSSTAKIGEYIPCGYSVSTIWGFDHIEDKHILYHGKAYMKIFCLSLEEHEKNIIDFEKKEVLLLTKEELKLYQNAKVCYISGKRILKNTKDKNYWKVRDHCHCTGKYRGAAHSICNLKFNVLNEIPVVFHNGSNYDHDFIIKELANKFEGQLECLGENKEK